MTRQRKSEFQKPISDVTKEKSGAQKLKRKREIEEDTAKLQKTSAKYFKSFTFKKVPTTETSVNSTTTVTSSSHDSVVCEESDKELETNLPQELNECEDEDKDTYAVDDVIVADISTEQRNETESADLTQIDLLDPSTWPLVVPESMKKAILLAKVDYGKIHNSPILFFYYKYLEGSKPNGELFIRDWLRVSTSTYSAFCLPCCFFLPTVANRTSWANYSSTGYQNFNNSKRGITRHESGGIHLESVRRCKGYLLSESNPKSVCSIATSSYKEHVAQWKLILRGIVESIYFLAQNNLAFQGKSHNIGDPNCGNFLNLIKLLGKYYTPLGNHVENLKKNSVSYLSPKIQNDFIKLFGNKVKDKALRKIRKRTYFSMQFDSTPDISHDEQVSQIIRSVKCSKQGCKIEEHFIDFIETVEKTGQGLADVIVEKLKQDNLDIKNCRGQGYDNGPNMAGKFNGVRAHIERINSEARFIPCAAHSLNLVGVNTAEKVSAAKSILGTIQNLYVYFSSSPSRWKVLTSHTGETLKFQSSTRWSSKYRAVKALHNNFQKVVDALEELTDSDIFNSDTVAGAQVHLNEILTFKFLFGLVIWHKILFNIDTCNVKIQTEDLDASAVEERLSHLLNWLIDFKETGLEDCLLTAKEKAVELGIDIDNGFENVRRGRGINSKYDTPERVALVRSISNFERFKIDFFHALVDKLILEMTGRFKQIRDCVNDFSFLWGDGLKKNFESKVRSVKNLVKKYPNDFCVSSFINEIESFYKVVEDFKPKKAKEIVDDSDGESEESGDDEDEVCGPLDVLNIIYRNGFENAYVNCETALRIFLTLPVSVATNERAFSKLKIIKTYLRSSMGQERLTSLAIVSIEHEIASKLKIDDVIDDFVAMKCRRVNEI